MTVTVPEFVGSATQWALLDYVEPAERSAKVNSFGVATITYDVVDAGRLWQLTRAVIACSGTVECTLRLYSVPAGQPVAQAFLRSGSRSGLFDEADYPGEGLWVVEGRQLIAQWTGAAVGALVTCSIDYRLMGQ